MKHLLTVFSPNIFLVALLLAVLTISGLAPRLALAEEITPPDDPDATLVVTFPNAIVPEAPDFATLKLGDPWDMNDFGDISQYFNESSQRAIVRNLNVSGGIFAGQSVGSHSIGANGYFTLLFPGYRTAVHTGQAGSKTPIDSAYYRCFYVAMQVNSPAAQPGVPDQYRVFFFANDKMNDTAAGGIYGVTNGIQTYPEYGANQPVPFFKLFKIDLATTGIVPGTATWNSRSTWQGLRLDPTIFGNVDYQVDWVRLTNCAAQNVPVSFTPNGSINSVWVRPAGTSRDIRVATNVNGSSGSYNLDTQGLMPGQYTLGFGTQTSCCTQRSSQLLTINSTPVVYFDHPSFTSEYDSDSNHGLEWDFDSSTDVNQVLNVTSYQFEDSKLELSTASGPLPAGTDAQIRLKVDAPIDTNTYRYLSYKINTSWLHAWQNVPGGMITRLVWSVQGSSGRAGYRCNLVSQDLPFDVGEQVVTVDLHAAFDGSAEEVQGECSGYSWKWKTALPALELRLDPNENVTSSLPNQPYQGGSFVQMLDWVRLSQLDRIKQGEMFVIRLAVKNAPQEDTAVSVFYTNNPDSQPTQHLLASREAPSASQGVLPLATPSGSQLYLPFSMRDASSSAYDGLQFMWNTTGVPPGDYYICAVASNGYNSSTTCSEVAVTVTPP